MTFQFDSLAAFVAMGKHGIYVWSVVGFTLLIIFLLIYLPLRTQRQLLAEQQRLSRIEVARQRTNPTAT